MKKSKGHVAFIGPAEFYKKPNGELYRAKIENPIGKDGCRKGDFYTLGSGVDLALRLARLAAAESDGAPKRR